MSDSQPTHPSASALDAAFEPVASRFIVGIDLGTTNCAMAYVDTKSREPTKVEIFQIEQLIDFSTVDQLPTLPSFHYELAPRELEGVDPKFCFGTSGKAAVGNAAACIVGTLARERVIQAPGRGFGSAKSWLCHAWVDRTSDLLPWQGDDTVEKISPVEASRRYLEHLRRAWDRRFASNPLAEQDVVITLPASFDEVARQLTFRAAQEAGLGNVLLIEEPQAAFYAWLDRHQGDWDELFTSGETILVCDIGGGTTDFTLIRVLDAVESTSDPDGLAPTLQSKRMLRLHRVAVGKHLMLGGDNMDLALARLLEVKFSGSEQLSARQWESLIGNARKAKEVLLSETSQNQSSLGDYSITLSGGGSKLIGSSKTIVVEREWAQRTLLEGFFGKVPLDAKPAVNQEGFQEFGLPYENEPNVHVHLANFLWEHRWDGRADARVESRPVTHAPSVEPELAKDGIAQQKRAARPDWVLFNGGVLESSLVQQAILDQIREWFVDADDPAWKPKVLAGNRLDLAVAQGAAVFGLVRRGQGVRIDARLAKAYYMVVNQEPKRVVCVMPSTAMPLDRFRLESQPFDLLVGEPVQFPLVSSSSHLNHGFGEVLAFDPASMTDLAPICTVLEEPGRKGKELIRVQLETELSEIGTLKLSLVRADGQQRWNLEFDVRGAQAATQSQESSDRSIDQEVQRVVHQDVVVRAYDVLDQIFSEEGKVKPKEAFSMIAKEVGIAKRDWPASFLREIWRGLLDRNSGRMKSAEHEGRWLNLVGWSLRPGYGFPVDDWRVQATWKTVHNKLAHKSAANVSEAIVLWRRISGGFTAGQQQALFQDTWPRVRGMLTGSGQEQLNLNVAIEQLRLLGSLERLKVSEKSMMVEGAFAGLGRRKLEPLYDGLLWMIGRLGNRVPVYATIQQTPSIEKVENWLSKLLELPESIQAKPAYGLSLMLLGRLTGDRYRDVRVQWREQVEARLRALGQTRLASLVIQGGGLDQEQLDTVVGESLPLGFTLSS